MKKIGKTTLIILMLLAIEAVYIISIAGDEDSWLTILALLFLTFCALLTWPIIHLINKKSAQKPAKPLTPEQLRRYNITRIVIIIAAIAIFTIGTLS